MKLKKQSGISDVGRQVNRSIIAATIPLRNISSHIQCSDRVVKMKPTEL
jgi:hypothetical protein